MILPGISDVVRKCNEVCQTCILTYFYNINCCNIKCCNIIKLCYIIISLHHKDFEYLVIITSSKTDFVQNNVKSIFNNYSV